MKWGMNMDEKMFSQRVHACADRLWRISWSILRNGADCDDALQNALLCAWRGIRGLKNDAYFETWLTRILINESRSLLRKRARLPGALPEAICERETPENVDLSDTLGALEVKLRLPLVLHYMEGYSVKEISDMLCLPETTVKWRMHAARKQLRDEWKK